MASRNSGSMNPATNLNAEEMAEKVQTKLKPMYRSGFLAKSLTKDIPNLERSVKR